METALYILARLVGVFYAFGGYIVLRTLTAESFIDKAIASIESRPEQARHKMRQWFLGLIGVVSGTSGVALAMLSWLAAPLFVAGLALQIAWIAWSARAFPPRHPEEVNGRRRTLNAALIYFQVTVVMVYLAYSGLLHPWNQQLELAVVSAAGSIFTAWLLREMIWRPSRAGRDPLHFAAGPDGSDSRSLSADSRQRRVRLDLRSGEWPLQDADTGEGIEHFQDLPDDLAGRIEMWDAAYRSAVERGGAGWATFETEADRMAHAEEGHAIAGALEAIYGEGNVAGPFYPPLSVADGEEPPAQPAA